jgi:hypothetical protein
MFKVKLYTNPKDRKMLLNFDSCHPFHIKKALPFMMARRVVLICWEPEDKWKELSMTLVFFFFFFFKPHVTSQLYVNSVRHQVCGGTSGRMERSGIMRSSQEKPINCVKDGGCLANGSCVWLSKREGRGSNPVGNYFFLLFHSY